MDQAAWNKHDDDDDDDNNKKKMTMNRYNK